MKKYYHCKRCEKMVYLGQMDMISFYCWKCKGFKGLNEVELKEAKE